MNNFLTLTGLIIIIFFSAFGWGRLVARRLYLVPTRSFAYDASLGLTVWVFFGGILNLFSLISPLVFDAILVIGLIFAAYLLYRKLFAKKDLSSKQPFSFIAWFKIRSLLESVPVLIVFAVSVFYALYVLPTSVFNYHDDYYKYLPRLVRMLQSGTVGGTPFDLIGTDSFGAHAFLQGFFLTHLPLTYANGFDLICCFLLGGLLVNDIGRKVAVHWFFRAMAVGAYIIINPLYANISSLYVGSLMILGLVYSSLLFIDNLNQTKTKELSFAFMPFVFFSLSLFVLKLTFAPFAAFHLVLFFFLVLVIFKQKKTIAYAMTISAVISAVMFLPWVIASTDKLVVFYSYLSSKTMSLATSEETSQKGFSLLEFLFSNIKLPNDGIVFDYNIIAFCILGVSLGAMYLLCKEKEEVNKGKLIVVIATGFSALLAFLVNYYFARIPSVGIRYSCPLLISVFPVIIILIGKYVTARDSTENLGKMKKIVGSAIVVMMCIVIANMHIKETADSFRKLRLTRTMLVFPVGKQYLAYSRNSILGPQGVFVRALQYKTEPDTTIAAWLDTPFHLDFARNRIFIIASPNQINGGVNLKDRFKGGGEWLRNYLKSYGVRYVLWGYKDPPRQSSKSTAGLEKTLNSLGRHSKVVFNDGQRVMFDIENE